MEIDRAREMVAALAGGCRFNFWSEDHTLAVAEIPPVAYPGFFQTIFLKLQEAGGIKSLTVDQATRIATEATEEHLNSNFFLQFDERLDYYQSEEQDIAMQLFQQLTRSTSITRADLGNLFSDGWTLSRRTKLLTSLAQDDFIQQTQNQGFTWGTPLVEAWWKERDILNG